MTSSIATHEAPVWKDKADFIIFADLSAAGMPGRWEQLWARQLSESEFELCCIPFFSYGLALGDKVRTAPSGGRTYVVADVDARSGRRVLRLWLKEATRQGRELVLQHLESYSVLCEWSSENLLAIDVMPARPSEELDTLLSAVSTCGVLVEWGDE